MISLGLDPGTATGYALLGPSGERVFSGVWSIGGATGEHRSLRWARLATRVRGALDQAHELFPLEARIVAVEHAFPGTTLTAELAGGHLAIIEFVAYSVGVPSVRFEYSTIKRHATGSGRASKCDMLRAANNRWGLRLPYDEHVGEIKRTKDGRAKLDKDGRPLPKDPTFPGGSDNHADALWIASAAQAGTTLGLASQAQAARS